MGIVVLFNPGRSMIVWLQNFCVYWNVNGSENTWTRRKRHSWHYDSWYCSEAQQHSNNYWKSSLLPKAKASFTFPSFYTISSRIALSNLQHNQQTLKHEATLSWCLGKSSGVIFSILAFYRVDLSTSSVIKILFDFDLFPSFKLCELVEDGITLNIYFYYVECLLLFPAGLQQLVCLSYYHLFLQMCLLSNSS